MKKLILFVLCFITIGANAQEWDSSLYRSAPKVGECVAVTGISILGLKAVGLLGDRFNFHDATAIIGYALGASGVYIAVNQGNHKQRKMNGGFYASANKIGFKLNF